MRGERQGGEAALPCPPQEQQLLWQTAEEPLSPCRGPHPPELFSQLLHVQRRPLRKARHGPRSKQRRATAFQPCLMREENRLPLTTHPKQLRRQLAGAWADQANSGSP